MSRAFVPARPARASWPECHPQASRRTAAAVCFSLPRFAHDDETLFIAQNAENRLGRRRRYFRLGIRPTPLFARRARLLNTWLDKNGGQRHRLGQHVQAGYTCPAGVFAKRFEIAREIGRHVFQSPHRAGRPAVRCYNRAVMSTSTTWRTSRSRALPAGSLVTIWL